MSESNMGDGGGATTMPEPVKRKRKAAVRNTQKPQERKTLVAAVTACIIAVADLIMNLKFGIKLF